MSFKKMLCMLLSATMIATSVTPALAGENDKMVDTLKDNVILQFDFDELITNEDGTKTTPATIAKYNGEQLPEKYRQATVHDRVSINEEKGVAVFTGGSYNNTGQHGIVFEPYSPSNGETVGDAYDPMKELTGANTTISAWVTTDYDAADATNYRTLFAYEVSTNSGSSNRTGLQLPLVAGNSTVFFRVNGSGSTGYKMNNIPNSVKSGKRQLYTYVEKAGEAAKLYIDGVLVKTEGQKANVSLYNAAAAGTKIDTGVNDWYKYYIGVGPDQTANDNEGKGDRVFKGEMDSLTIYNKALTKDEISELYDEDEQIIAQKAAEAKAEADQKAADAVVDKINAIPEYTEGADLAEYKSTNQTKISEARTAYDALTADQKALVSETVLKKLTDAEELVADASVEEVKPGLEKAIAAAKNVYDPGNEPDETTGDTKWTKDTWKAFVEAYEAATEAVKGTDAAAMTTAKVALERAQAALKEYKNDLVLQFDFKNHGETDEATGKTVVYGTTGSGRTIKAIAHGVTFDTDDMLGEDVVKFHKAEKGEVADAGITYDAYNPYDPVDADHWPDNLYDPNGNGNPYNPYDPMNELIDNHSTISMWIRTDGAKFSSPLFSYGSLKANGTDVGGLGASLQIHGRQAGTEDAIFYRDNGGNTGGQKFGTNNASPYFADQWQLMVLVEDGNSKILYANGEEIGRSNNIGRSLKEFATDQYYKDKIYIGYLPFNDANNQDTHFEGTISTVSVYNRAYSAEEVMAMYMEKGPLLNYNMAEAAYKVINQLPDVYSVTAEDEAKVVAAREAYDKLIYQAQKDWLEGKVEDNPIFADYKPIAVGTLARIEKAEEMLAIAKAKDSLAKVVAEQADTYTKGKEEGDWTDDSWAAYKAAYEAAANPADDVDTVEEFKALEKALKDASEALVTNAEIAARAEAKKDLQKAIDEVKATYEKGNDDSEYSSSTWSKFKTAYINATKMMDDDTAFSDEIADCKDALLKAKEGLSQGSTGKARAALRAALEAAKAAYEAGNANNKYTADSWTAFTKAYTDATAIVDVNKSNAQSLNNAAKALTAAQEALKLYVPDNNGGNNNGGAQPPVLTNDEQAIKNELGVTDEVAQAINKVAADMKIDKATLYITEKDITSFKKNADIKGTNYLAMQVKVAKQDNKSAKLTWKKVKGADGYIVYGAKADKKAKFKKLTDTTKNTYTQKKLKKGTDYKYIVVAYKNVSGTKVTVAASKTVYTITKGGKYGVAKKIAFKNVKKSKTLRVKKSFTLKTKETKAGKKIKKIVGIRYESSNPKVATVNSKGKIKAIKKGSADIYAYSQNGMVAKMKVRVK